MILSIGQKWYNNKIFKYKNKEMNKRPGKKQTEKQCISSL